MKQIRSRVRMQVRINNKVCMHLLIRFTRCKGFDGSDTFQTIYFLNNHNSEKTKGIKLGY